MKIFLMLFIAVGVLSLIGSTSAATDNITNNTINSTLNATDTILTVSNVTSVYNSNVNLTATLADNNSNLLFNQTVSFTVNGTSVGSDVTDSNGTATLNYPINLTSGIYNLTAVYAGDESLNYAGTTATGTLTVQGPSVYTVDSSLSNSDIQTVINNANVGDTVKFLTGIYHNISLNITQDLNLISVNATLDSIGTFPVFSINGLGASGTNITGFTINGSTTSYGINLNSTSKVSVNNNTVTTNLVGIHLSNSTNNTITNNTVSSNGNGVIIADNSTGNIVTGNSVRSNTNTGVTIQNDSNNTIIKNTISSNKVNGILLVNSTNNSLVNNNLTSNTVAGIVLQNSSNNTINGGNYFHMDNQDIYLNNSSLNNLISNNTIYGCPFMPKYSSQLVTILNGSNNNTITSNIIQYSILKAIDIENSNYTTISNNNIGNPQNTALTTYTIIGLDGIILNNTNYTTITGNTITGINGTTYTLTDAGIYLTSNNNTVINGNIINGSAYGIKIGQSNNNTNITGNNITNTNNSAIYSITNLITTNTKSTYNNTVNLTASLTDGNGNPVSGKTVTFTVNNTSIENIVTDNNGIATLNYLINLTPGNYNITAIYTGDQNYTTSNSTGTLTVLINPTKLTVSDVKGVYNNIVNLTASLKDNSGKLVSGKTVSFTLNGIKIGNAVTNSNGVATLKYTLRQIPGAYKIITTYTGNENYTAFNTTATLKVLINPTKLAVSNVKSVHKHTVNLTAKLSDNKGKPVSGKTVSFTLNGIKIGSGVTNSNGVATLKYTLKQTRGVYKLKAIYTGNKNYKATNTTATLRVL